MKSFYFFEDMRTSHDLEPDFSRPGISPRDSVPSPDHTCDNISSSKANFKAHISLCLKWRWFPSVSVTRRQAVSCSLVSAVPGPACSSLQHCSTRPPNCSCVQRCSQGGDRAPQSLSPQLTKMCHFIIITGCQQCSPASNPRLVHLSSGVRGLDSQKSSPASAWPSHHLHSPKDHRWLKLRPLCLYLACNYNEDPNL